ncbi:FAD binding domain-containing protein [Podospora didyma]|uniref:FAD binding domain-containing protein n=1 Tax=Podospora didyma TaxID=330526 RepID=A0AAE0K150_9PEZI|nr:FAD binding domain-containing protein [Podospora didyma]
MAALEPFTLALNERQNGMADAVLATWRASAEKTPTLEIVPPGLDAATWAGVVAEFQVILGENGVLTSHEHRVRYHDPYAEHQDEKEQEKRGSSATLFPITVEHVQAVLRICNTHKIPIWTISQGKNLGYGGPAPRVKGSIILDMKRMNKVLEVNDRFSYYTVEPGVTFFDIYKAIQDQKKNIWCSVPALGWGSVVGNALDRGWGYTPAGDHSNQICGIEVVLADGTVVRTGMGALDKSVCWPLFRGGYGPTYESMFSQSNFGVVTKLSLWASPSPECFTQCRVDVDNEEDLAPLIDIFQDLLIREAIQNHPLIGNLPRELVKRGPRSQFYGGEGAIPDSRLKELQQELGIGWWSARFSLYGPKEINEVNYKRVEAAFKKLPGAKVSCKVFTPGEGREFVHPEDMPAEDRTVETGTPSLMALKAVEYRGKDGGHISFSPILPADGKAAVAFYYAAKARCAAYGFEYFGGLHLYPRHLAMINMMYFDRTNTTERHEANKLFVELVKLAREHGYSEYRAHVDYMDLVAEQFDFNGQSLMQLNQTIKDALDPNGILSPGKQGIWPESYRGNGKGVVVAPVKGPAVNGVNGTVRGVVDTIVNGVDDALAKLKV